MLFRNRTHQQVWIENNCHTCFQPDEAQRRIQHKPTMCPILARALISIEQGKPRKPSEWERTRSDEMAKTIKCNAYQAKPSQTSRQQAETEDVPMFDMEPHEAHLIPVDGWPDPPPTKGVDHA